MVVVEPVPVATILPLRAVVLRGGRGLATATFPQDDLPATVHLAAFRSATEPSRQEPIGCATWFPDALPDGQRDDPEATGWRLRGLAVSAHDRGSGVGSALVRDGLVHGRHRGYRVAWCNARLPAVAFYTGLGWRVVSEEFHSEHGPHVRMLTDLAMEGD